MTTSRFNRTDRLEHGTRKRKQPITSSAAAVMSVSETGNLLSRE